MEIWVWAGATISVLLGIAILALWCLGLYQQEEDPQHYGKHRRE